jgi:hypothetical protein
MSGGICVLAFAAQQVKQTERPVLEYAGRMAPVRGTAGKLVHG